jgi:hypothetical protein
MIPGRIAKFNTVSAFQYTANFLISGVPVAMSLSTTVLSQRQVASRGIAVLRDTTTGTSVTRD